MDDLPAGALLGNAWLHLRHANISYLDGMITYPEQRNFVVPFVIKKQVLYPVVRKVMMDRGYILAPGETACVTARYTKLPEGRSFMFTSTYPMAMNALVDLKSPYLIVLHNATEAIVKVDRRT